MVTGSQPIGIQPQPRVIDFNLLREGWADYRLSDGNVLRVKLTISKVIKTGIINPDGTPQYNFVYGASSMVYTQDEYNQMTGA
jgi:hypothetical protein